MQPGTTSPGEAVKAFSNWPQRALFTIENEQRPGTATLALRNGESKQRIPVYPATLRGLRRYAAEVTGQHLREADPARLEPEPLIPEEPPRDGSPETAQQYVSALRAYCSGDPRLLLWLASCSLYPNMSLDLTLRLGMEVASLRPEGMAVPKVVGASQPGMDRTRIPRGPLVTDENLVRLLRLEWFRRDEADDLLRLALRETFRLGAGDVEDRVRTLLIRWLGQPPQPREDTLAWDRFRLERGVQERLRSSPKRASQLREQMQRLPLAVIYTHPLLPRLLRNPRFDVWPDRAPLVRGLMRALFRHGVPRVDNLKLGLPAVILALFGTAVAYRLAHTSWGQVTNITYPVACGQIQAVWDRKKVEFPEAPDGTERQLEITVKWKPDAFSRVKDRVRLSAQTGSSKVTVGAERGKPGSILLDIGESKSVTAYAERFDTDGALPKPAALPPLPITVKAAPYKWEPSSRSRELVDQTPVTAAFTLKGSGLPAPDVVKANLEVTGWNRDKIAKSVIVTASGTGERKIQLQYQPASADLLWDRKPCPLRMSARRAALNLPHGVSQAA